MLGPWRLRRASLPQCTSARGVSAPVSARTVAVRSASSDAAADSAPYAPVPQPDAETAVTEVLVAATVLTSAEIASISQTNDVAITKPTGGSSNNLSRNTPATSNGSGSGGSSSNGDDTVTATKLALLEQLAALDRGSLATTTDKQQIEWLVQSLEQAGAGADPFAGSPAAIEGRWKLLYTNTEVFRASPFFLAFQDGLVQDKQIAEAIFKFTDAIPGAEIKTANQVVSLLSNSLVSEVDMAVFPGLTGTVVTSSRVSVVPPRQLRLTIESTRVTGSTFSPLLDNISVPVEQLISQVRGPGSTEVLYDITYVDDTVRVTRAGEQLLVHGRVL